MALVTKGALIRPSFAVGYEVFSQVTVVTEDVEAGDLLILTADGWSISTAANPTHKRGFAVQDYLAGRADCSIATTGELEGFTGLTPGVPLYPAAAGDLETTAVVGFTGLLHAVSETAIAFTL